MELKTTHEQTRADLLATDNALEGELARIRHHAQIICDLHWENIKEEANRRVPRFITRVRATTGSLQCHWLRAGGRPPTQSGGKIQAVHVPKGTGRFNPRYKQSAFNSAEPWEREIIDETENNYAILRERYMVISKMKNDLDRAITLAMKSFDRVGIPWDQ